MHADAFCSSLSRARIAIHGATWTHSRISTRMYLHVIHIRGWKVVTRSPGEADRWPESTWIRCWSTLAVFVPASSLRPWSSYLSRPPMGVVPSSNRDYGLRRGRCSPRAPRTRILYLPEKSSGSLDAHVCASTVCPERIGSLLPRQLERFAALLLVNNITFKRYGRD